MTKKTLKDESQSSEQSRLNSSETNKNYNPYKIPSNDTNKSITRFRRSIDKNNISNICATKYLKYYR